MLTQGMPSEEALQIWRQELWPDREDPIRPMSSMTYPMAHDLTIYTRFTPSFFGLWVDEQWVGVISGHRSSLQHYRARGLYLKPAYRGRGLSQSLLRAVEEQALREDCQWLWSYPRLSAWPAYEAFGFQVSPLVAPTPTHLTAIKPLTDNRPRGQA